MPDDASDLDKLFDLARQGGSEALGELLQQFHGKLLAIAKSDMPGWLAARVDPSDIVQDTLQDACRDFASFRGSVNGLLAWLRQILQHNIADEINRQGAGKRDAGRDEPMFDLPGNATSPSSKLRRKEQWELIERALAELPEKQRHAVRLRHFQGWELTRIAGELGLSYSATAGLVHRGLQTLREKLGPVLEGSDYGRGKQ